MARVLSFLISYFSNYYTLHRSDLAARAAPLDPRLINPKTNFKYRCSMDIKVSIKIVVMFSSFGSIFLKANYVKSGMNV